MGILNKIGDMIFGPEEYADDAEEMELEGDVKDDFRKEQPKKDLYAPREEARRDEEREILRGGARKGKVVNITSTTQFKVVVLQPESFEEAREIADNLKANKPVIVNLEKIEKEQARRMVDFVSGASYALGGDIQKISNMIFLVTPYNVGILGDFKDELKNKGIFPWSY